LGSPLFIPLGGVRGEGREKRKNEMLSLMLRNNLIAVSFFLTIKPIKKLINGSKNNLVKKSSGR